MKTNKEYEKLVEKAAKEYVDRKSRKAHPAGKFDGGGRWYPAEEEKCSECGNIRRPSKAYPYSLLLHCRTAKHIADKYNIDLGDLKKAIKKLTK